MTSAAVEQPCKRSAAPAGVRRSHRGPNEYKVVPFERADGNRPIRHIGMETGKPLEQDCSSAGRVWHIYWQAAPSRDFLSHELLQKKINGRLLAAHAGPGRTLLAYCLLPGEIHAVSRLSGGVRPRDVARSFGNIVSRWVGRVHRVKGPVLAGPFCAEPVDSPEDLRWLIRMLAWRPVVLGLARTPSQHAHASVRSALGLSHPPGFSPRELLLAYAQSVPRARLELRAELSQQPTPGDWHVWELAHGLASVVDEPDAMSSSAIRAKTVEAAMLIAAGATRDIDGALLLLQQAVCRLSAERLHNTGESLDVPSVRTRALVGLLALRFKLCSAARVARFYSRAKSTLSEQMAVVLRQPTGSQIVATPIDVLIEQGKRVRS